MRVVTIILNVLGAILALYTCFNSTLIIVKICFMFLAILNVCCAFTNFMKAVYKE